MESQIVLLLTIFNFCFCEWVLLPTVLRQNEAKVQTIHSEYCFKDSRDSCKAPESIHNLTTMTYGNTGKNKGKKESDWEISMDYVEELVRETEKLPRSVEDRTYFVRCLADKLETEAENRLRSLFSSRSRQARTTYLPLSMEGSLMTISMLLFGVYLSKLVLKLLQSQNRYNTNIGMISGIRGPIRITKGRQARDIKIDLKKINLMHLIDKYNARFH